MISTRVAFHDSANPIVWFRAILMDLGFAGLIEEIEKRFGKFVTTLVLGVLLLAIFLWGLEMVGRALVEVERLQATGSTFDMVKALAIRLGILVVAGGAIFGFVWVRSIAFAKQKRDEILRFHSDMQERTQARLDEMERERRKSMDAAWGEVRKLQAAYDALPAMEQPQSTQEEPPDAQLSRSSDDESGA